MIKSFTDLEVWKTGHELVVSIYKTTSEFPKHEQFGLTSQMKRSSSSVTANLAEGFGRRNSKEKEQFYLISSGSLFELKDQLLIARDVGYIDNDAFLRLAELANKWHSQLNAMLNTHRNRRNSKFQNRDSK